MINIAKAVRFIDVRVLSESISKLLSLYIKHPIWVSMDVSSSCNISCTICKLREFNKLDQHHIMSLDVAEAISAMLPNTKLIYLQSNCEPLLNNNIAGIVSKFKTYRPHRHVVFATNGTLLLPALSKKLVESNLDEILFSIDGSTAKTYESIRVGASFETVLNNIKMLGEIKSSLQSKLPEIGIVTVTSKENVDELEDIICLAQELGAKSVRFNGLETYDKEMDRIRLWAEKPETRHLQIFKRLKIISKKNKFKCEDKSTPAQKT